MVVCLLDSPAVRAENILVAVVGGTGVSEVIALEQRDIVAAVQALDLLNPEIVHRIRHVIAVRTRSLVVLEDFLTYRFVNFVVGLLQIIDIHGFDLLLHREPGDRI